MAELLADTELAQAQFRAGATKVLPPNKKARTQSSAKAFGDNAAKFALAIENDVTQSE